MLVLVAPHERHGRVLGRRRRLSATASRLRAASAPCSAAFVQCSTRISSSNVGLCQRTRSPAAKTPGTPVESVGRRDDPVAQLEATAVEPGGGRRDADADDDVIGRDERAVAEPDAADPRCPRLRHRCGCPRRCPDGPRPARCRARHRHHGSAARAPLRARRPRHRPVRAVAATSSPMNPAPMTTTRTPGSTIAGAQCDRVVEAAQHVHVRRVGLAGQPPRVRAGGDDQPVERHVAAIGERDRAGVEVEARRPARRVGRRGRAHRTRRPCAGRCGRRPTCRRAVASTAGAGRRAVSFGPDQRDRAAEPGRPQRLARPQAGERAADDDDPDHARTGRAIELRHGAHDAIRRCDVGGWTAPMVTAWRRGRPPAASNREQSIPRR